MKIIIIATANDLAQKFAEVAPNLDIIAVCTQGEAGWEAASALKPDAVFLNLDLPDTSGLELMRHLAALCPALIVCSEWTTYAFEALQVGVTGYLLLPLQDEELRDALARANEKVSSPKQ